jgi:hypothetical protein
MPESTTDRLYLTPGVNPGEFEKLIDRVAVGIFAADDDYTHAWDSQSREIQQHYRKLARAAVAGVEEYADGK